jgi:hypothetical protein
MKASEFVKKFGLGAIKDMLQKYPKSTHVANDACVFINSSEYKKHAPWFADDVDRMVSFDDLKRLVESHELVMEHGAIERAKEYANSPYTAPEVKERLKQAIADVESCQ